MVLLILELEWGQRNNMKVYNQENYHIDKSKFSFAQENKKITDSKFETKPTTFAKDAFKRFCKNKSSVVAAFIIGFLLLGSFLIPLIDTNDIKSVHPDQSLLIPKIFNAGTGFWDGTKKYNNIAYSAEDEAPLGFKKDAIISMEVSGVEYINQPYRYALGGYLKIATEDMLQNKDETLDGKIKFLRNYKTFNYDPIYNYQLNVNFGDIDNITDDSSLGEYRIRMQTNSQFIEIQDWSKKFGEISINLNDIVKEKVSNAQIRFEVKPQTDKYTYILIKNINISCDNEEINELLSAISFDDANAAALVQKQNNGTFPDMYWQSNANRDIYQAEKRSVSFVYDEYEDVFGKRNMALGSLRLNEYIEKGWVEYDYNIGPESFKVLDENSPVIQIYSQTYDSTYDIYTLNADVIYYKYIGMKKIPKYIFGTDVNGKDIFKLAFSSLKTSLLIAILSSAVCLFVGLVWGSISGYFGGNVDLVMERFCEILSGVPWIVVMTLTILLLGNNIGTFALALCLTGWIGVASRTRTQFYRFKGREYVLASRTLGSSDTRLIFKHILPNALGTIVTSSVLMIPSVIFSEATLAYLNLGLQGVDSFGVLLSDNQQYLATYPALIVFPAIIISLLMISFNLFGNGLRDALNPSLKGSD